MKTKVAATRMNRTKMVSHGDEEALLPMDTSPTRSMTLRGGTFMFPNNFSGLFRPMAEGIHAETVGTPVHC